MQMFNKYVLYACIHEHIFEYLYGECTLKVILSSSQCMNIFSQFFDAFQNMVECSCL